LKWPAHIWQKECTRNYQFERYYSNVSWTFQSEMEGQGIPKKQDEVPALLEMYQLPNHKGVLILNSHQNNLKKN
jgi:hypothetical protein